MAKLLKVKMTMTITKVIAASKDADVGQLPQDAWREIEKAAAEDDDDPSVTLEDCTVLDAAVVEV